MKVSVITPTIDADEVLERTLKSVDAQTYDNIEHIIVDGCDSRHSLSPSLSPGIERKHYFKNREGVYDALNFGIKQAKGDIIGLLHGGDVFASPDIIKSIAALFANNSEIDFIYGNIRYYNAATGRLGRLYSSHDFKPELLACGMAPPHPSLYIRREAAERIGKYRTDLRLTGDLDMWMRIFADSSLKGAYFSPVMVNMSLGGLSTKLHNRLIYNNIEKMRALKLNGYKANPFMLAGKYVFIVRNMFKNALGI